MYALYSKLVLIEQLILGVLIFGSLNLFHFQPQIHQRSIDYGPAHADNVGTGGNNLLNLIQNHSSAVCQAELSLFIPGLQLTEGTAQGFGDCFQVFNFSTVHINSVCAGVKGSKSFPDDVAVFIAAFDLNDFFTVIDTSDCDQRFLHATEDGHIILVQIDHGLIAHANRDAACQHGLAKFVFDFSGHFFPGAANDLRPAADLTAECSRRRGHAGIFGDLTDEAVLRCTDLGGYSGKLHEHIPGKDLFTFMHCVGDRKPSLLRLFQGSRYAGYDTVTVCIDSGGYFVGTVFLKNQFSDVSHNFINPCCKQLQTRHAPHRRCLLLCGQSRSGKW